MFCVGSFLSKYFRVARAIFYAAKQIADDRGNAVSHKACGQACEFCDTTMSMSATPPEAQSYPLSSGHSDASGDAAHGATQASRSFITAVKRLSREPLLHFALLGAIIFGVDAVLHPAAKDEKVIT